MNYDKRKKFPNQNIEGRPTECVAESIIDIAGNIDNRDYDSDFTYASALRLMGVSPDFQGSDPLTAMYGAICYGLMPDSVDTFDPITKGQTYCADWENYSQEQTQTALLYAKGGIDVVKNDFDSVVAKMNQYQTGLHISMIWHGRLDDKGRITKQDPSVGHSYHEVACYGVVFIDGEDCLILKPWLGPDFADHGYCYLPRSLYSLYCLGAYAFNPNAWRLGTLISIALTRYPYLLDVIYSLMPGGTNRADRLYYQSKAAIGETIAPGAISEVGCAYCVDTIYHRTFGSYIGGGSAPEASTASLLQQLIKNPTMDEIAGPERGAICIAATGTSSQGPTVHGHTGIVGNSWIMSNDSNTGVFEANYTPQMWHDYFETKEGFKTRYFKPI